MFALIALLLFGVTHIHGLPIDSLGIKAHAETKWYSYTNKETGFYFGEVHGINDAPYQGWTVYDNPVLKDYSISVNGKPLDRSDAQITIYPGRLVRKYKSGVTETFTLLDHVNAFLVQLKAPRFSSVGFRILFNSSNPKDFALTHGEPAVVENKSVPPNNFGRWVAVAGFKLSSKEDEQIIGQFASPAVFKTNGKEVSIVVACGKTKIEAERTALEALRNRTELVAKRKKRMQEVLNGSYVKTSSETFDKALAWAKLSLNALITNQGMRGIWAGLPWFNDYWGRDSFISLPGATLWLGDFKTAREILLDFAAKQDTDSTSTNYGRIPNLITPSETVYNTADGTPWFVNAVFLYYSMTGDRNFLFTIFSAVRRAFDGTVKYHMDKDGFLTHGDQETWMDAVGPNGPYVPRGNRAVDVQSLWLKQLLVTRFLSKYAGDIKLGDEATYLAKLLIKSFEEKFIDTNAGYLYDHLNANGVPDTTLRPNQLFALWMVADPSLRAEILKTIVEKLTYPWGVASLYQGDPNFHPFHHDEPYYVPDAAYHNGTVWVWLTGQLVSNLAYVMEQDFAFKNTMFLANEILDGKTAGTLPELFDAFPRAPTFVGKGKEKPNESGAFSQAWSLAEFVNSFYQDYLGVQMDAAENTIILNPRLPRALHDVTFKLNGGNNENYMISYRFEKKPKEIEIAPTDSVPGTIFRVFFMRDKERQIRTSFYLQGKDKVLLKFLPDTVIAKKNGAPFPIDDLTTFVHHDPTLDSLHFETPKISLDWNFSQETGFKILKTPDVKKTNSDATIFANAEDPVGDDKGQDGKYTYPLNQNFRPGILDITHAEVSYDSENVYFKLHFKNLVNPMWHPEYGFQLTFAAIAIGNGEAGQRNIGRNSNYTLPKGRGFQKVIYVGGGIEVFDKDGKKIAAYVPAASDTTDPLGIVDKKEISFSLPMSVIGKPDRDWKISILVGAQDDHGGGGVGEFRTVGKKASEWQGGGKESESMPNIYDDLFLK